MFTLKFSSLFLRKEKKLIKNNNRLRLLVDIVIDKLAMDPENPSLKSHKIIRKNGNKAFSSSVTGDIRIIWMYQNGKATVLDILDIGSHSGNKKVYK